ATRGAVEDARPGVRALPVEVAGGNDDRVAHVVVGAVRRAAQLRRAEAVDVRVFGVGDGQLLARGGLDHLADADNVAAFVGCEPQTKALGRGDDVEHAAIGDIDVDGAELGDFDGHVEVGGEGGHVA